MGTVWHGDILLKTLLPFQVRDLDIGFLNFRKMEQNQLWIAAIVTK